MANRFWVGDGGNWSDALNHWSASSGGAPNASKPTSADNVYFDANSFTIGAQTVTVDETANCLAMDWTGATNTPTLTLGIVNINYYGSTTLIANMVITSAVGRIGYSGTTTGTLTTNGVSIGCTIGIAGTGTLTLADAVIITETGINAFNQIIGNLVTGNNNITVTGTISITGAAVKTTTLGSSVITGGVWNVDAGNLTFNADTSTIRVTGTGGFSGYGKTYNNVELNGTAHTISGSNTFSTLTFAPATTQTITFTDGTTQTITTPVFTGSSGKVKTLVGSSTGGWTITKAGGGTVDADYLALSYSEATPGQTWYTANSTDTVGNSGWIFAWVGKFLGVTNPAKVNGIAVRTIQKINGVT